MRVALSGSPGTGKTTVASLLEGSVTVESVLQLAKVHGALGEEEADGARSVDVEALRERVASWPDPLLVEGHLSHLLGLEAVVVLRCNPTVLRARLEARGYDVAKVQSNVEWEKLGGVLAELLDDERTVPILELDATHTDAEGIAQRVGTWLEDGCPDQGPARIDWLE